MTEKETTTVNLKEMMQECANNAVAKYKADATPATKSQVMQEGLEPNKPATDPYAAYKKPLLEKLKSKNEGDAFRWDNNKDNKNLEGMFEAIGAASVGSAVPEIWAKDVFRCCPYPASAFWEAPYISRTAEKWAIRKVLRSHLMRVETETFIKWEVLMQIMLVHCPRCNLEIDSFAESGLSYCRQCRVNFVFDKEAFKTYHAQWRKTSLKHKASALRSVRTYQKRHPDRVRVTERKRDRKEKDTLRVLFGTNCFICGEQRAEKLIFHQIHGQHHLRSYKYVLDHIEDFTYICYSCHNKVHWAMQYLHLTWNQMFPATQMATTSTRLMA